MFSKCCARRRRLDRFVNTVVASLDNSDNRDGHYWQMGVSAAFWCRVNSPVVSAWIDGNIMVDGDILPLNRRQKFKIKNAVLCEQTNRRVKGMTKYCRTVPLDFL